jgi:hypothetical protein
MNMTKSYKSKFILVGFLGMQVFCKAELYEVGPGKVHKTISSVPWESLQAGDTVSIYWQAKPYHEKWVLCCRGTQEKPITVSGVAGPDGQLPVIDGQNAVTRDALNYYNEERGVLKIGSANRPADTMPAHIVVENLEIRCGRVPYAFSGRKGVDKYSKDAASVFVEKGEHLVLRNLVLHDSGNGLMVSSQSSDVRVEGCHLYDNGNPGSITEHNAYTECNGIVFEANRFGPLREGCRGNNLKDRSAGLVVAYNWIEGGNRQLDLVDATGNPALNASPAYRRTLVYSNVIIERDEEGSNQIVHYGGDSDNTAGFRKGVLFFYHNTVVSTRPRSIAIFRVSTPEETVECHGNILHTTSKGKHLSLMCKAGMLKLGKNWLTSGWVPTVDDFRGEIRKVQPLVEGAEPGFTGISAQDFTLRADSANLAAAAPLPSDVPLPARRYIRHQKLEVLPPGAPLNLGAQ